MSELILQPELAGVRLDSYLSDAVEGLTRSAAQGLIAGGAVTCAGKVLKKNYKLVGGEVLVLRLPPLRQTDIVPEDIALDLVYEDADIIVVNKSRGMVVHPAAGNWSGTLVNALMFHCGARLSGINGEHRPGIVHRIDKDTSGLLVVAKNDAAHQSLAAQIAAHTARREYQAIVIGSPRAEQGTVDKPIARHKIDRKRMTIVQGGRDAITHYEVLRRYAGYTHMAFSLETGRTHQIRVHMAAVGHPVIGDPLYGREKDRFSNIGGQCLHAVRLTLSHPQTEQTMVFTAALPDYFEEILAKLQRME